MKNAFFQLMALSRRLWRPWSAEKAERRSSGTVARAIFTSWLAGVVVAAWMAQGDPPGMLTGAAVVLLWVLGPIYFFGVGFPHLVFRLGLIIRGAPQGWTGIDQRLADDVGGESSDRRGEALFKEMRALGAWPEDLEPPPGRNEDIPGYLQRTASRRPTLHRAAQAFGAVLIIALAVGGQPVLGAFYAVPSLGWIIVDWLERRMMRCVAASSGVAASR